MIVTHECPKCHMTFDGHYHRAKERAQQFPHLGYKSPVFLAQVCPECGDESLKQNLDSDEDFNKEDQ